MPSPGSVTITARPMRMLYSSLMAAVMVSKVAPKRLKGRYTSRCAFISASVSVTIAEMIED